MAAGAVAVVGGVYWFYFAYLGKDLPKTAILRRQNDAWQSKMGVIRHKLDVYESMLSDVEARNDLVYRSIFALDPIPDSTYADSSRSEMQALDHRLDEVADRIGIQISSLGEVALVAKEAGDIVSHIPAVPPLCVWVLEMMKLASGTPVAAEEVRMTSSRAWHWVSIPTIAVADCPSDT